MVVAPESDPSAGWFRVPRSSQAYQISAFPTFKLYALPKQELGSVRGGNIEGIETLLQQAKSTIFDGAGNTMGGAAAEVREEKRREEKRREEKRREEKRREATAAYRKSLHLTCRPSLPPLETTLLVAGS